MDYNQFSDKLISIGKQINVDINEEQVNKFYKYMELLLEWNEKMNLTAITEPDEVILKHFIDSITAEKYINKEVM